MVDQERLRTESKIIDDDSSKPWWFPQGACILRRSKTRPAVFNIWMTSQMTMKRAISILPKKEKNSDFNMLQHTRCAVLTHHIVFFLFSLHCALFIASVQLLCRNRIGKSSASHLKEARIVLLRKNTAIQSHLHGHSLTSCNCPSAHNNTSEHFIH